MTKTDTTRNRKATEDRLREALKTVLVAKGFGGLTPGAIAAVAGVDKMLIYRYFGGLAGLVEDLAQRPDFFPTLEEICDGAPDLIRALPVPERATKVTLGYARLLLARPVVLELMVWELVERNELTAIMETARETTGLRIVSELFGDVSGEGQASLGAITGLLGAAVTYLAIRQRKIRWFNGVDIRSEGGWLEIEAGVRLMTSALGQN